MEVEIQPFESMLASLVVVCGHENFCYYDWSKSVPLLEDYKRTLTVMEARQPGFTDRFKLGFQYLLTIDGFDFDEHFQTGLDYAIPKPNREWMLFLWANLFPGEPWERAFPPDVRVTWP